jgi:drug/metabolite transporter (DMT)-like permease
MPIAAIALVLSAAVAHATWNYLAKGAPKDLSFMTAFTLCALAIHLPIAIIAWIWVRPSLGWEALGFVAVSGALDLTYFIFLARGYAIGDLSLVYPLARGTGPALSVAGAVLLLGEDPSPLALAGSGIIVVGILFMAWSPGAAAGRQFWASIAFALATGICIAAYTLWDSEGVDRVNPVIYNYLRECTRLLLLAPLTLATPVMRSAVRANFAGQRTAALGVGLLAPAAYLMVLAAYTLAPVSYVAPAREVSIVVGAVLGWRLLGEGDAFRRVGGAIAIVAGVFFLALG